MAQACSRPSDSLSGPRLGGREWPALLFLNPEGGVTGGWPDIDNMVIVIINTPIRAPSGRC